jgi:hypothetical protein
VHTSAIPGAAIAKVDVVDVKDIHKGALLAFGDREDCRRYLIADC